MCRPPGTDSSRVVGLANRFSKSGTKVVYAYFNERQICATPNPFSCAWHKSGVFGEQILQEWHKSGVSTKQQTPNMCHSDPF